MSRLSAMTFYNQMGFPRVSGDEPWVADMRRTPVTFSPRERG